MTQFKHKDRILYVPDATMPDKHYPGKVLGEKDGLYRVFLDQQITRPNGIKQQFLRNVALQNLLPENKNDVPKPVPIEISSDDASVAQDSKSEPETEVPQIAELEAIFFRPLSNPSIEWPGKILLRNHDNTFNIETDRECPSKYGFQTRFHRGVPPEQLRKVDSGVTLDKILPPRDSLPRVGELKVSRPKSPVRPADKKSKTIEKDLFGKWECTHCTFLNASFEKKCMVCFNPREEETNDEDSRLASLLQQQEWSNEDKQSGRHPAREVPPLEEVSGNDSDVVITSSPLPHPPIPSVIVLDDDGDIAMADASSSDIEIASPSSASSLGKRGYHESHDDDEFGHPVKRRRIQDDFDDEDDDIQIVDAATAAQIRADEEFARSLMAADHAFFTPGDGAFPTPGCGNSAVQAPAPFVPRNAAERLTLLLEKRREEAARRRGRLGRSATDPRPGEAGWRPPSRAELIRRATCGDEPGVPECQTQVEEAIARINAAALLDDDVPIHSTAHQSPEEVARSIMSGLESHKDAGEVDDPEGLTITLMPHQRKGVAWCMKMEENPLRNGGMLCDQMGLGKTIQMIALFLKTRERDNETGRHQRVLVLAPLAVLDQWHSEIKKIAPRKFRILLYHGPKRLKDYQKFKTYDVVLTTYGTFASEYAQGNKSRQKMLFKLPTKFFYRMVMDEGHTIRNHRSNNAKAAFAFSKRAKMKWILSGTPIQNKMEDLYPIMKWLQIEHCDTLKDFKDHLGVNKHNVSAKCQAVLSSVMLRRTKRLVLPDLPPRHDEILENAFEEEIEREIYVAFQEKAQDRMQKYINEASVNSNYASILALLVRLRQICDHPYLALKHDVHHRLVLDEDEDDGKERDENADPLEDVGEDIIRRLNDLDRTLHEIECPICLDLWDQGAMISECGHLYCREHLLSRDLNGSCPECRRPFDVAKIVSFEDMLKSDRLIDDIKEDPNIDDDEDEKTEADRRVEQLLASAKKKAEGEGDVFVSSTKTRLLVQRIRRAQEDDPSVKILVFSSFVQFLRICEEHLARENIGSGLYHGSMTREDRTDLLDQFRTDRDMTVLLMSLRCANLGLNLTCATRVIFVDLWWNPAVEAQAVDRAHRIGQTKDVFVERLMIENTVEQRILALQQTKTQMADAALDGAQIFTGNRRLTVQELRMLFGMR